jgi:hypothetical protein
MNTRAIAWILILLVTVTGCTKSAKNAKAKPGNQLSQTESLLFNHLIETSMHTAFHSTQIAILFEYIAYFDYVNESQAWDSDKLLKGLTEHTPIIIPIPSILLTADESFAGLTGQYDYIVVVKNNTIEIFFLDPVPNVKSVIIQRGLYSEASRSGVDLQQLFYIRCLGEVTGDFDNEPLLCDIIRDGVRSKVVYSDPARNIAPMNPAWDELRKSLEIDCSGKLVSWTMQRAGKSSRFCVSTGWLLETLLGSDLLTSRSDGDFERRLDKAICSGS